MSSVNPSHQWVQEIDTFPYVVFKSNRVRSALKVMATSPFSWTSNSVTVALVLQLLPPLPSTLITTYIRYSVRVMLYQVLIPKIYLSKKTNGLGFLKTRKKNCKGGSAWSCHTVTSAIKKLMKVSRLAVIQRLRRYSSRHSSCLR